MVRGCFTVILDFRGSGRMPSDFTFEQVRQLILECVKAMPEDAGDTGEAWLGSMAEIAQIMRRQ